MLEHIAHINSWLGKRMFLLVLSALVIGFNIPIHDSPAVRVIVIALFAYMTFITALETSLRQFIKILSRPWVPLWALLLVHVVTPLLAWWAGYIFFPEDIYIRIGYLISASIPVGVTSVIWTSLANGNVAVSLVTVTVDTLIAPLFLPAFFAVTLGKSLQIDYVEMAIQLMWMITIPSIMGMVWHDLSNGKVAGFAKHIGGVTSKIAFTLVIVVNAAMVAPEITWDLTIVKMLVVTFSMVAVGYFIGYIGSFVFKNRPRDIAVAMIYNVGLRNISAGLVLALTQFPPPVAIPMTLYIMFQQPTAAAIPYILKRFSPQEKQP
jgi:predicted Na+-dependent transporter